MHPEPGLTLGNRYSLSERLATGGMGEVWMAHDDLLRRIVAIKILGRQFLDSPEFTTRFRAEARHSASLAHPGVASVYDYAEEPDGAYLVMEFVPGQPLSALLSHPPVPAMTTTLSILAQTADALAAAHAAGIIHRDVKPGNIMITPDGVAKVTDFGIARAIDAIPLTAHGQVVGTPQYMSPEQASGQPVGPASDLYSLGVVGYEMLAGRRPFVEPTPLALAMAHVNAEPPPLPDSVPEDLRELIERAMAKQPERRPPSAAAFASELRAVQMRITPPPSSAGTTAGEQYPVTVIDGVSSGTRLMPVGGVAVAAPGLIISGHGRAPRRPRRLPVVAVIGAVVLACALLVGLARRDAGRSLGAPSQATSTTDTSLPSTTLPTGTQPAVTAPVVPTAAVATTALTATPDTVVVDPVTYVGKPAAEVRRLLEGLGLHVDEVKAKGKGHPGDIVIDVQPTGSVSLGSTISVTVGGDKGGSGRG